MPFVLSAIGCVRSALLLSVVAAAQTPPPKTAPASAPPSAPATSAPHPKGDNEVTTAKPPDDAGAPRHASPKEAVDAFIAATAKKDWKTAYRCFAADAQDLLVVQVITMFQYSAAGSEEVKEGLDALLKKHDFDAAKSWSEANAAAKASKGESERPDARQLVKTYASSIKDKESLFVDLLNWANEHYAGSEPVKGKPVRLEDLAATGDTATGKLTNGTSETWKVALKAVDGNWQFVLPEEQYQPSGWNDGFLFGYLDAIHAWRF